MFSDRQAPSLKPVPGAANLCWRPWLDGGGVALGVELFGRGPTVRRGHGLGQTFAIVEEQRFLGHLSLPCGARTSEDVESWMNRCGALTRHLAARGDGLAVTRERLLDFAAVCAARDPRIRAVRFMLTTFGSVDGEALHADGRTYRLPTCSLLHVIQTRGALEGQRLVARQANLLDDVPVSILRTRDFSRPGAAGRLRQFAASVGDRFAKAFDAFLDQPIEATPAKLSTKRRSGQRIIARRDIGGGVELAIEEGSFDAFLLLFDADAPSPDPRGGFPVMRRRRVALIRHSSRGQFKGKTREETAGAAETIARRLVLDPGPDVLAKAREGETFLAKVVDHLGLITGDAKRLSVSIHDDSRIVHGMNSLMGDWNSHVALQTLVDAVLDAAQPRLSLLGRWHDGLAQPQMNDIEFRSRLDSAHARAAAAQPPAPPSWFPRKGHEALRAILNVAAGQRAA